jgi:hypothetical protein
MILDSTITLSGEAAKDIESKLDLRQLAGRDPACGGCFVLFLLEPSASALASGSLAGVRLSRLSLAFLSHLISEKHV